MRLSFSLLFLISPLAGASILGAPQLLAHSGGLNAAGCHAGSQPYHCHRSQSSRRQSTGTRNSGGDMDCADFASWRAAQVFFEQAGPGDPHRLDRDRDGIACEALR